MKDREKRSKLYRKSAFCIYFLTYILGLIDAVYKDNILVDKYMSLY